MYTTEICSAFSVNFSWDHPIKLNSKITTISVDDEGKIVASLGGVDYTLAYPNSIIHSNHPSKGPLEHNLSDLIVTAAKRQGIRIV